MMSSSASAEVLTISRYSRCSGCCGASSSSSVMPSTPFIGVRISWLMLARNSLLARLAASAAVLASRSAAVWVRTRRRSVTIHASDTATRPASAGHHPHHAGAGEPRRGLDHLDRRRSGDEQAEPARHGAVAGARRLHGGHAGHLDDAAEVEPRTRSRPAARAAPTAPSRPASIRSTSSSAPTTCWRSTPRMRTSSPSSSFFSRSLPGSRCASGSAAPADALHHGVLERRRVVARLREPDGLDDVARGERHRLARVHLEAAGFVAQEDLVAAGDQHGALDPHQVARAVRTRRTRARATWCGSAARRGPCARRDRCGSATRSARTAARR